MIKATKAIIYALLVLIFLVISSLDMVLGFRESIFLSIILLAAMPYVLADINTTTINKSSDKLNWVCLITKK